MLVRAYRLTDRVGVVFLKSSLALSSTTLAGLALIWGIIVGIFTRVFGILGGIATRVGAVVARPARNAVAGDTVGGRRRSAAAGAMARRPAHADMDVSIVQDPLRTQNRVLSLLVIVLGVAVLGVILWATDSSRNTPPLTVASANPNPLPVLSDVNPVSDPGDDTVQPLAPTQQATAAILSSPVPTVTPLPALLEVRGSLAYVVREQGQTDIWAIPVGSRSPLRLTNSPEDERDPAWSPDGRRLAYASRQDGNWELYVYDLDTGETTRMTYDLSFQAAPYWSPDGEWLVYESYQGNNLDLYIMRVDGSQEPLRLTDHASPDFAPSWSPDGRRVAFVSWRDGSKDIFLFSLDDPRDAASVNITNTPQRHEDHPLWSPDGQLIAFSAVDQGIEKVFVKTVDDLDAPAQVLERGRTPAWSPDGESLVFAVDSVDSSTHLVASPFAGAGVATEIIPVPYGATHPVWSAAPLPQALINEGGLGPAVTSPLYVEQASDPTGDPPYRLRTLTNVNAPNSVLSERVDDSFAALREAVLEEAGWDFLGRLGDAFWQIDHPPAPGEERRNWLMTGRAFALDRNAIVGFPPPLEVVREDLDVNTYWRVFLRVADEAQSGQLGEPLRDMPWDFASRNQGDVEAYDQGGRLRAEMPDGYYIDLTQVAADFGWERMPAGNDWRANFNSTKYWLFHKPEGLTWYEAMRELYTEAQLGGFAPRAATPVPVQPTDEEAPTEPPVADALQPTEEQAST